MIWGDPVFLDALTMLIKEITCEFVENCDFETLT